MPKYQQLPLPIRRVGTYPLEWMLADCMLFLSNIIWTRAHTEAREGMYHDAINLHAIHAEFYSDYPKTMDTFAVIYVSRCYRSSKDLWFPPWSAYVERHEVGREALDGNRWARAMISLFAFEFSVFFSKGFCRFDRDL